LLTVKKSDVEWSAHPGRNVPGCDRGSPVAVGRSLTVCAGELCGRLAMEGYDLSKQCKRPTKERCRSGFGRDCSSKWLGKNASER
ncbi:MAG TPA: hypothetical protein VMW50_08765, partial [Dehalococcoidia bacterium]|nr:hypothetical protein [Dehalococcoidia bacterium]